MNSNEFSNNVFLIIWTMMVGWLLQTAPLLCTKAYIWTGYLRVNRSSSPSVSQCYSRFIEARYLTSIRTWKLETVVFCPSTSNLRIVLPYVSLCVNFNVFKSQKVFINISDSPHTPVSESMRSVKKSHDLQPSVNWHRFIQIHCLIFFFFNSTHKVFQTFTWCTVISGSLLFFFFFYILMSSHFEAIAQSSVLFWWMPVTLY